MDSAVFEFVADAGGEDLVSVGVGGLGLGLLALAYQGVGSGVWSIEYGV